MPLIIFLLIILMLSVSFNIEGVFENYKLNLLIVVKIFYVLPIKIRVFNTKADPLSFYYRIFQGKRKSLNSNTQKIVEKAVKDKSLKNYILHLYKKTKVIKKFTVDAKIGFKDRADLTAIFVSNVLMIARPILKNSHIKEKDFNISPCFNCDICFCKFNCIITARMANIIFETIRYFIWRR